MPCVVEFRHAEYLNQQHLVRWILNGRFGGKAYELDPESRDHALGVGTKPLTDGRGSVGGTVHLNFAGVRGRGVLPECDRRCRSVVRDTLRMKEEYHYGSQYVHQV